MRTGQVLVIRGDYPFTVPVPPFVTSEVAPTRAAGEAGFGRWMPLLPQRGMRPRDPGRGGWVRSMGLMSAPWNLPEFVSDGTLAAALAPLGVDLLVRTDPVAWTRFDDLDLVLCARRAGPHDDSGFTRKPATKLTNAWVAGCVPLVFPEAGYLELARPDEDALVVRSAADVVAAVERLQLEPRLVERVQHGVRQRASEFGTAAVLDVWEQLLWSGQHPVTARRDAALDVIRTVTARVGRRLRRAVTRGGGGAARGA